jgi:hypothetical protein
MYWQPARHPRAGAAIALAIAGTFIGALGVAFAADDGTEQSRGAAPAHLTR